MDYVLVQVTVTGEIIVLCWGLALSRHSEVDLVPRYSLCDSLKYVRKQHRA